LEMGSHKLFDTVGLEPRSSPSQPPVWQGLQVWATAPSLPCLNYTYIPRGLLKNSSLTWCSQRPEQRMMHFYFSKMELWKEGFWTLAWLSPACGLCLYPSQSANQVFPYPNVSYLWASDPPGGVTVSMHSRQTMKLLQIWPKLLQIWSTVK
jgi:hypothetical protein